MTLLDIIVRLWSFWQQHKTQIFAALVKVLSILLKLFLGLLKLMFCGEVPEPEPASARNPSQPRQHRRSQQKHTAGKRTGQSQRASRNRYIIVRNQGRQKQYQVNKYGEVFEA